MDFYKKQIETALKNMFYWMRKATETTKQGERAYYELMNATQESARISEYKARIDTLDLERGTETVLDWETMTADAIKQACETIEQEQD